jgi:hypothetical protein
MSQPRYRKEEFARRGDTLYETKIRPLVKPATKASSLSLTLKPASTKWTRTN